jgi:hypothetical protein
MAGAEEPTKQECGRMKSNVTAAVLGVCSLIALPVMADGWKLSLGPAYRSFDDVDFKPLSLSSSGGAYVNGYWTADDDYLVLSDDQIAPGWVPNQQEFWRAVSFDQVMYEGGSDGWGGTPGAVLALAKQLKTTESGWSVSAKASLGWFSSDLSTSAQASELTASTFVGFFRLPVDPGTGIPTAPVMGGSGPPLNEPIYDSPGPATTSAALAMAAEMDLYVLSLGVQLARQMGPVALSLEVGPTLNLVDFDTSVSQTVAWTDGGYSSSAHDDVLDVLFGVYAAGGVSWQFNERFEVGLEARWDEVFEDAETDFAEMDLSGFSVSALFGVSF